MKILLTGGSGMVGRNFLEHPGVNDFTVLAPSSSEMNLLNYSEVLGYISNHKPDIIIHAAGRVGGIQANIKEPVRFLLENLDMGRNIVWAAHQAGVLKLINLGSSCMYPHNAPNPLKEDYMLNGQLEPTNEGYALAKITTAKLCEYIHRENPKYQYKTLIPCNLYGRWDKFDPAKSHLIPAIIHKIHSAKVDGQKKVVIWGDGSARREFMYAGDFADCLVRAVKNFESLPEQMNVGLGFDFTIKEYYQAVAECIGYTGDFDYDLTKPAGMKQKLVDISKQTIWGWSPKTSCRDGIAQTYDFYKKYVIGGR